MDTVTISWFVQITPPGCLISPFFFFSRWIFAFHSHPAVEEKERRQTSTKERSDQSQDRWEGVECTWEEKRAVAVVVAHTCYVRLAWNACPSNEIPACMSWGRLPSLYHQHLTFNILSSPLKYELIRKVSIIYELKKTLQEEFSEKVWSYWHKLILTYRTISICSNHLEITGYFSHTSR